MNKMGECYKARLHVTQRFLKITEVLECQVQIINKCIDFFRLDRFVHYTDLPLFIRYKHKRRTWLCKRSIRFKIWLRSSKKFKRLLHYKSTESLQRDICSRIHRYYHDKYHKNNMQIKDFFVDLNSNNSLPIWIFKIIKNDEGRGSTTYDYVNENVIGFALKH
jgi:hypothetical protein